MPAVPREAGAALGSLGVRIFFVISGYLITSLLLRELDATGTVGLGKFYARRTIRIFPACYAYIGVVGVLVHAGVVSVRPHDFTAAVTYTMCYFYRPSWWLGHLWSLSVEEQFYLLWPGILFFGRRRIAGLTAAATVIGGPALRGLWWALLPDHRFLIGRAFPTVVDALAMGCLCAFHPEWRTAAGRLRERHVWLLVSCGLLLILVPQLDMEPVLRRPFRVGFDTAVNALIACWLLRSVAVESGAMSRVLNCRLLVTIGILSYSLYLWPQLFMGSESLSVPLAVAGALSAATLSYWVLERPLVRFRRRLRPPGLEA